MRTARTLTESRSMCWGVHVARMPPLPCTPLPHTPPAMHAPHHTHTPAMHAPLPRTPAPAMHAPPVDRQTPVKT